MAKARNLAQLKSELPIVGYSVTYLGGVLGMIEAYVGEDRFREGVRLHMKRFANGVATSDDFFKSLAEGAKAPEIADALRSFTDQPNAPLVTATRECRDNKPVIKLSQSTYRPLGSTLPDRQWTIPICVTATAANGAPDRACILMREPAAELALPQASCSVPSSRRQTPSLPPPLQTA